MSARLFDISRLARAAVLASFFLGSAPAAALPAIADFGTVGYQNTNSSMLRTLGWIFTTLDAIAVTQLGVWDRDSDGLVASHEVGIWDASGTLLGSATVQAGAASPIAGAATAGGSFRYEAIAPILLNAGATYTIGALFDSNDVFEFNSDHVDTGAAIAFGEERYGDEGAGFTFPTDTFGRWGLFGPNFQYELLPEPEAAVLFGLGLLALGGVGRRQRRMRTA